MSGVCGNNKIVSRENYRKLVQESKDIIKDFTGFVSIECSGSFNSNKNKTTFGDLDLITYIDGSLFNSKKEIKSKLAKFMTKKDITKIVPFTSEKYKGKRYYNSGEIITVSLKSEFDDIEPAQVDFIIATSENEFRFKKEFLDMTAEKQGLVLGLVKTVFIENNDDELSNILDSLNIDIDLDLPSNQEYEFSLSSKELQLRKITYENNTFKEQNREILYTFNDFDTIGLILPKFDLNKNFFNLLIESKSILKKQRSLNRIKGVFKSMVTIKSGERNTEKGYNKERCIAEVDSAKLDSVGLFVGRFQPVTNGHLSIIERMSKENKSNIIFLVKGKKSSLDKESNPFDLDTQIKMLNLVMPKNVKVQVINTGFFINEINEMNSDSFVLYAGSDRIPAYTKYTKYLEGNKTLEIKEIQRTDEDVSATQVRKSLKDDNKFKFMALTPKKLHTMYDELKEIIKG